MFHCRQRRAGPKHPAPEETDRRLAPADFPNIKEGGTFGRFFRRALVTGSGDDLQRSEDAIIAYSWDKYLKTGDEKWPLRLPMTKAAVRAMDTATDFLAGKTGGKLKIDRFVVAGASKRGWTTWSTAAVDKRVVGI
ncbi:MAG TPA: hypothetical protein EYO85_12435, partial [Rhodospirillales bacterium]|nr:hypothetical protein [Rhodospirillales bacterium]